MKYIITKIKNCNECPFSEIKAIYEKSFKDIYKVRCKKKRRIIVEYSNLSKIPNKIKIPNWCPLDDFLGGEIK